MLSVGLGVCRWPKSELFYVLMCDVRTRFILMEFTSKVNKWPDARDNKRNKCVQHSLLSPPENVVLSFRFFFKINE